MDTSFFSHVNGQRTHSARTNNISNTICKLSTDCLFSIYYGVSLILCQLTKWSTVWYYQNYLQLVFPNLSSPWCPILLCNFSCVGAGGLHASPDLQDIAVVVEMVVLDVTKNVEKSDSVLEADQSASWRQLPLDHLLAGLKSTPE